MLSSNSSNPFVPSSVHFWISLPVICVLAAILCFVRPNPGSANEASRMATVESLHERSRTSIEGSMYFNTVDVVYHNGHFYSDKPPAMSLAAAALIRPLKPWLGFSDALGRNVLYYLIVVCFSLPCAFVILGALRSMVIRVAGAAASSSVSELPWVSGLVWTVIPATPLLPYLLMFNNHTVEAACLAALAAVLTNRNLSPDARALAAGMIVGVMTWIHLVLPIVAAPVLLIRFLLGKGRPVLFFILAAATASAAGLWMNQVTTGTLKPQYLIPENYYYPQSDWLKQPTTPGLTEARLKERLEAVHVDARQAEKTLHLLSELKESKRGLAYEADRFKKYGFLIWLNPLVVWGFFGWIGTARVPGPYRADACAVLAIMGGVALLLMVLRSQPGYSFSDRHLLPIVPLASAGAFLARGSARLWRNRLTWALLGFWVSVCVAAVPFPWRVPGAFFISFNGIGAGLGLVLAVVLWVAAARAGQKERDESSGFPRVTAAVLVGAGLAAGLSFQLLHYFPFKNYADLWSMAIQRQGLPTRAGIFAGLIAGTWVLREVVRRQPERRR